MKIRLNPGLTTRTEMRLNETRDVSNIIQIQFKTRLIPGFNGGSNAAVRENYDEPPAANRACKDNKAK